MRVVIVNKYGYIAGGADRHCVMLANGLRERGYDVAWLGTAAEWNREGGGAFVPRPSGAAVVAQAMWSRPAAGAMQALIERFDPDVVHSHMLYPYLSVSPLVVAHRAGVPVVHTLHTYELISANYASDRGEWIDRADGRLSDRMLNSLTYPVRRIAHPSCVDHFIAVSEFVADIHRRHGIAAEVVPNAIEALDEGSAVPGFDERQGVVFAGRLIEEKGVRDVIDVARRRPELPVELVGTGPLQDLVRRESAALPNLQGTGWIHPTKVSEHLRRARVLVMPSRCAETSGLVALEALACGTPVVAFDNGGLGEVVRRSGAGRVIDDRGNGLAAVCAELHSDRATWEQLSARGLAAVAGPFSSDSWLDAIEAVYQRAVGQPAPE